MEPEEASCGLHTQEVWGSSPRAPTTLRLYANNRGSAGNQTDCPHSTLTRSLKFSKLRKP